MSVLPIVGANENTLKLAEIALRQKSSDVDINNKHSRDVIKGFIEDLFATLYESHPVAGVGLAAPQVGVLLKIAVIDYTEEIEDDDKKVVRANHKFVLINPRFTFKSDETIKGRETCLSFPTFSGEVERSTHIKLEAYDQHFELRKIEAKGWLARIFQHELDHLDGYLYADRMTDLAHLSNIDYPYVRQTRATIKDLYKT